MSSEQRVRSSAEMGPAGGGQTVRIFAGAHSSHMFAHCLILILKIHFMTHFDQTSKSNSPKDPPL